ncbi:MAG: hypothetical protein FJ303_02260 [Planctomycetes bacterium]|nr:hypothetical protein [Planctomycetota bacterium]
MEPTCWRRVLQNPLLGTSMKQHFILCGLGKVGWRVLEYLRQTGDPVTVVDNRASPDDSRLEGIPLVRGDCRQADVLKQAGLAEARGVIVLTSDDLVSFSTALMIRHLHPTIRIVVRMFNESLIERLGDAARNIHALSTSALASPLLAMIARTGQALGIVRLKSGESRQIAELTIAANSPLIGRRLKDLADEYRLVIVAHVRDDQPAQFVEEVDPAQTLAALDRLVVIGDPASVAPLVARGENESLPELLWAGLVYRLSRVAYGVMIHIDLPVQICTGIFIGAIAVSVLVFVFGMQNDTLIDSFYRTISLLTTGADMRGEEAGAGTWQKGFITAVRLVGVGLTAAFTAIFTNYLIRANLGAALEIRRIPESGHIIVCGLGNVGFRIVETLRALDEPVVVIEENANSPFISTARRLGAAVIIGSAAVAEVLRQANAATARAVIAATSKELINLEIALLVREMSPRERIVIRLTDPHLAMTLRSAANVPLALSIPELSAPAFVARLYDDQVFSLIQVEERVLAVYELTIQSAESPFYHITHDELRTKHGFLPVHHCDSSGKAKPLAPGVQLEVGDHVTGVIAIEKVQTLYHALPSRSEE